jgi:hypothetical protein
MQQRQRTMLGHNQERSAVTATALPPRIFLGK